MSIADLPPDHFTEASECELALVGACILEPSRIDVIGDLLPGCFHDADLGAVFGLLVDLRNAGKPIADVTLLTAELRRAGLLERLGGPAWIAQAVHRTLAHHVQWYAERIVQLWRLRVLHSSFGKVLAQCCLPNAKPDEIALQAGSAIDAALQSEANELESMGAMLDSAIAEIDHAKTTGQQLGLSTRLPTIDRETGGFFPGDLTILAARPSIGKSAFALDIAARVAERGKRVLLVSLEMTGKQIAHRLLNRKTGIAIRRMQNGDLTESARQQIEQARSELRELPLKSFVTCKATTARIRARARVHLAQEGLDLLVIDYLQLIEGDRRQSSYERTTAISRELKALAIELNRPILSLSQLNRESTKAKVPTLEHLRDSGAIEQDADNVWLLHRENRDDPETLLIIAKQRQGPTGTIDLKFEAEKMRFDEPMPHYQDWSG